MRRRDLGLTQPLLVLAHIYVGKCMCCRCKEIKHTHIYGTVYIKRKELTHTVNAFFKGRAFKVWTTHSVRPLCSRWQPVKQENRWELKCEGKLNSLHAEALTFSWGWFEISMETTPSGELHLRVISRKSYTVFFGLFPSTYQLISKQSHGNWQPCRSFSASLQSLAVVLPWENTWSWQWVACLGKKREWNKGFVFHWHILPAE